jgi:integrase
VFTNERGRPVQQHPYAVLFEAPCKRAGLPEWATPHDLRHFYASTLIRSEPSVKVIQSRLGHQGRPRCRLDAVGPDESRAGAVS